MEEVCLTLGQWFSVISIQLIQLRSFKISKIYLSSTKSEFMGFLTHYLLTLFMSVSKSIIKEHLIGTGAKLPGKTIVFWGIWTFSNISLFND